MVSEEEIAYWVNVVNSEIGRTDRNSQSIRYFMMLRGIATFVVRKNWYLVMLPSVNMWGDRTLNIVSFYVRKEVRENPRYMKEIYIEINKFAKKHKSEYIIAGSHLNDKFNLFLQRRGFKVVNLIKEI